MAVLGIFTLAFVLIVVGVLLKGYVLTVLWGWFVVTTFGLPALSLASAIGIALTVSFLTHQVIEQQEKKRDIADSVVHSVGVTVLHPLLALLMGWIVQKFM